jgi:hypothetical protein
MLSWRALHWDVQSDVGELGSGNTAEVLDVRFINSVLQSADELPLQNLPSKRAFIAEKLPVF